VVEKHWQAVYRLLHRLAGNDADAEDLTQETFLRALQKPETFAAGTNMRAWLMRIATNAFIDLQRKRKAARAEPLRDDPAAPTRPEAGAMESMELGGLLEKAIARLPDAQRAVFLLRSREGLSFGQIAEAFGVSEETARWHMFQARKQLMADLDGLI
jgi:RNA polymerase sigma-70 factor (ECF subfamily)